MDRKRGLKSSDGEPVAPCPFCGSTCREVVKASATTWRLECSACFGTSPPVCARREGVAAAMLFGQARSVRPFGTFRAKIQAMLAKVCDDEKTRAETGGTEDASEFTRGYARAVGDALGMIDSWKPKRKRGTA